ncbi:MAG: glycosyltransferase family 39 protein [Anaerolineae bacterium]|nr:glycosyltransferase family 39 protein [Anaerolineae bacterium]
MRVLPSRRQALFILAATLIVLLAAALGIAGLDRGMLWWDELLSLSISGGAQFGPRTLPQVWTHVVEQDPFNAPAFYLVLNVWGNLVGWTAFADRALTLLLGLLTITLIYRLGSDMASRRVGLLAALLTATSAFYISYLHELRTYTLLTFFAVLLLVCYWRLVRPRFGRTWIYGSGLVVSATLLLYTHYTGALFITAIALYHLLFVAKNRRWWITLALLVLSGLLFMPWAQVLLGTVTGLEENSNRQVLAMNTGETLAMLAYAFSNGTWVLAALPLLALVNRATRVKRLALFGLCCTVLLALLLNLIVPFMGHIRYIMVVLPLWALAAALGFQALFCWRRLAATIVGAVWIATGVYFSFMPQFNDALFQDVYLRIFRPHLPLDVMADTLENNILPDDLVILHSPVNNWAVGGTFEYYMSRLPVDFTMLSWIDADSFAMQVQSMIEQPDVTRIWLAVERDQPYGSRLPILTAKLDNNYVLCEKLYDFDELYLEEYVKTPVCCTPSDNPMAASIYTFGEQVGVVAVQPVTLTESNDLSTIITWTAGENVPANTYSVALHVEDSAGEMIAQADYGLPLLAFYCEETHITLPDLPEGSYHLRLIVYNWQSGERLPAFDRTTSQQDDSILIGAFDYHPDS